MRIGIRNCFIVVLLISLTAFSGYAQTSQSELDQVQKDVEEFSNSLAKALPFNSTLGLNWSDAYIGRIFPSVPPHFGIGFSVGATSMEASSIKNLANNLGADISGDLGRMPIPSYTVEARVGGFILPFDLGFKFGFLPVINISDIKINFMLAGGDIRYAILDGSRNLILPNVSLGIGLNYLSGGIGTSVGSSQRISFFIGNNAYNFVLEQPKANFKWDTISLDLKAQVSKSFFFITPYLGLGGAYAWSKAGYEVEADITLNNGPVRPQDIVAINNELERMGYNRIDVSETGISSIIDHNDFNFRLFGGLSFNMMVMRLDITGLYSFLDNNFGASLGLRFQL